MKERSEVEKNVCCEVRETAMNRHTANGTEKLYLQPLAPTVIPIPTRTILDRMDNPFKNTSCIDVGEQSERLCRKLYNMGMIVMSKLIRIPRLRVASLLLYGSNTAHTAHGHCMQVLGPRILAMATAQPHGGGKALHLASQDLRRVIERRRKVPPHNRPI